MRNVRLVLRAPGLTLVTAALWLLWLAGALPAWLAGRLGAWGAQVLHSWARASARVIGMRTRVLGELGSEPCLLVANHLSYVDVLLLGAQRPCVFVAKSEVAGWPVLGFLARTVGTLFVERGRKRELPGLARAIGVEIARGRTVVLFPEGTSTSGELVGRFHPALLEPAIALGLPVHHAAIHYRTEPGDPPAELSVCWWGEMTFVRHLVGLLSMRSFEARLALGTEPLRDTDRKHLARRLHGAVSHRLALATGASRG